MGFVEAEDNIANSPLSKMMEEQRGSSKSFIKVSHCKASSHAVVNDEVIESSETETSCVCVAQNTEPQTSNVGVAQKQ